MEIGEEHDSNIIPFIVLTVSCRKTHIFFCCMNNNLNLKCSFSSYGLRRSDEDDKTDCMRLLEPLITERPIWDLFTKTLPKGKRCDQSLPPELAYLENAFCDLR